MRDILSENERSRASLSHQSHNSGRVLMGSVSRGEAAIIYQKIKQVGKVSFPDPWRLTNDTC